MTAINPLGSLLLSGRRGLVMGVANERSLAWGIAQQANAQGARLVFTYPNEAIRRRLCDLLGETSQTLVPCDVTSDDDIDRAFATVRDLASGQPLDFVVHAVSFAEKAELDGPYLRTSRRNFATALDISCYSLTAVAQRAAPLMSAGGSLLTLSYLGAERVIPNYNVMGVAKAALEASVKYLAADLGPLGIRVNAISAGPIKTLASSGIHGMRHIVRWTASNAPLRRETTIEDVGRMAVSLLSDLGRGVTGEIVHVDSGYHVIGMAAIDAASENAHLMAAISDELAKSAEPR